jgi:hypothetical protein
MIALTVPLFANYHMKGDDSGKVVKSLPVLALVALPGTSKYGAIVQHGSSEFVIAQFIENEPESLLKLHSINTSDIAALSKKKTPAHKVAEAVQAGVTPTPPEEPKSALKKLAKKTPEVAVEPVKADGQ